MLSLVYDTRTIYSSFVALRTQRWRREHLWIVGLVTSDHVVSTLILRVQRIIRVLPKVAAQCVVKRSMHVPVPGTEDNIVKVRKLWSCIRMRRRLSRMSCVWCSAW